MGSGCSKAVKCTPSDTEVMGLIPSVCGFFSLFDSISSASLIQVPQGGAKLLIFLLKQYT